MVFDLDDTLFLERQYVRGGLSAVAAHIRAHCRRHPRIARARADGQAEPPPSQTDLAEWMWKRFLHGQRAYLFDALSERFGLALTAGDIRRLVRTYRTHVPVLRPGRGVRALLTNLRRRRFRLGLLSDGYLPGQRLKLSALGLEKFFHAVVFTETLGRKAWKPSPRGFEAVRRRLGVRHGDCAYVADNPAKDFVAPNRLGWVTIQWLRTGQVHASNPAPAGGQPRHVVRSGGELLRLLASER